MRAADVVCDGPPDQRFVRLIRSADGPRGPSERSERCEVGYMRQNDFYYIAMKLEV
jgi:hypothetical protein